MPQPVARLLLPWLATVLAAATAGVGADTNSSSGGGGGNTTTPSVPLEAGVVVRTIRVPAGESVLLALPTVGRPLVQLSLFPCFGRLNWYAAAGRVPTPSNNSYAWTWRNDFPRVVGQLLVPAANDTLYVRVDALQASAAVFDFLALTNSSSLAAILPQPSSRQITQFTQDGGAFTVSLSWTPTGVNGDKYSVYLYPARVPIDKGYLPYSACGAEQFMFPVVDQSQVSQSAASVTVSNVDPFSPLTVLVVVERPGPNGYKSSYFPASSGAEPTCSLVFSLIFSFFFSLWVCCGHL